jgi:hypothetical protein
VFSTSNTPQPPPCAAASADGEANERKTRLQAWRWCGADVRTLLMNAEPLRELTSTGTELTSKICAPGADSTPPAIKTARSGPARSLAPRWKRSVSEAGTVKEAGPGGTTPGQPGGPSIGISHSSHACISNGKWVGIVRAARELAKPWAGPPGGEMR